jgi:hypothetical protein
MTIIFQVRQDLKESKYILGSQFQIIIQNI